MYGYDDYASLNDHGKNLYCEDKAFQRLLNKFFYIQQHETNIRIYPQIHLVKCMTGQMPITFGCVDSTKIVIAHLDSIKYTVFISAERAQYEWYSSYLHEFSPSTIETIRQQSPFNFETLNTTPPEGDGDGGGSEIYLVNFNPAIDSKELYRLMVAASRQMRLKGSGLLVLPEEQIKSFYLKGIFLFYTSWGPC